MKRALSTLVAVAVLTFGYSLPSFAHEGHDHKIMGTVTMAAPDHVMLKDKDGKDVTVKVTKDTKIRAKTAMKVEDLKAGARVVITATEDKDQSFTAKTIDVGATPAAAAKTK